jgi:hypothetical protein
MVSSRDRRKAIDPKTDRRKNKPCTICGMIAGHLRTCRRYVPKKGDK